MSRHARTDVKWQPDVPPGGFWWVNSGPCPSCGEPVAVESECEFREAP